MPAIDVHTPMLNKQGLELQRRHGGPRSALHRGLHALEGIFLDGAPFMTPMTGPVDDDERIAATDAAEADIAILSPTCTDVYWSGAETACPRDDAKPCAEKQRPVACAGRAARAAHINLT